jgi:cytochrome c oxidase subunit 2
MSKKSIAGGALSPVNEENLRRWVKNPPAVKPGTQMPNLGLSDQQVNDIVLFLMTLK